MTPDALSPPPAPPPPCSLAPDAPPPPPPPAPMGATVSCETPCGTVNGYGLPEALGKNAAPALVALTDAHRAQNRHVSPLLSVALTTRDAVPDEAATVTAGVHVTEGPTFTRSRKNAVLSWV